MPKREPFSFFCFRKAFYSVPGVFDSLQTKATKVVVLDASLATTHLKDKNKRRALSFLNIFNLLTRLRSSLWNLRQA